MQKVWLSLHFWGFLSSAIRYLCETRPVADPWLPRECTAAWHYACLLLPSALEGNQLEMSLPRTPPHPHADTAWLPAGDPRRRARLNSALDWYLNTFNVGGAVVLQNKVLRVWYCRASCPGCGNAGRWGPRGD